MHCIFSKETRVAHACFLGLRTFLITTKMWLILTYFYLILFYCCLFYGFSEWGRHQQGFITFCHLKIHERNQHKVESSREQAFETEPVLLILLQYLYNLGATLWHSPMHHFCILIALRVWLWLQYCDCATVDVVKVWLWTTH